MYAWCIASAHLQLENVLIDSFMVSNIAVNKGEGWNLIDSLPSPVCDGGNLEGEELPGFLHLCQMNRVGEWAIHKRKVPRDIFSCESTMLGENVGRHLGYDDRCSLFLTRKADRFISRRSRA